MSNKHRLIANTLELNPNNFVPRFVDNEIETLFKRINLLSKIGSTGALSEVARLDYKIRKIESILNGSNFIKDKECNSAKFTYHASHLTIECAYKIKEKSTVSKQLTLLLGEVNAKILIKDLLRKLNINLDSFNLSKDVRPILFTDSNNKKRVSQYSDFNDVGLNFAEDIEAVIYCSALVNKALKNGFNLNDKWYEYNYYNQNSKLSIEEREVLKRLSFGVIRTNNSGLYINNGKLRAYACPGKTASYNQWAFASRRPHS